MYNFSVQDILYIGPYRYLEIYIGQKNKSLQTIRGSLGWNDTHFPASVSPLHSPIAFRDEPRNQVLLGNQQKPHNTAGEK